MSSIGSSIDEAEVAKFERMAAEWWDPTGKFKPLHVMNPVRLDYCAARIAERFGRDRRSRLPFAGLRVLDIGCGGGLLSEPMARLGADVVGADAAARNIPVARLHAEASGLQIDYRHATAEPSRPKARPSTPSSTWRSSSTSAVPALPRLHPRLLRPAASTSALPQSARPRAPRSPRRREYVAAGSPRHHDWRKFITTSSQPCCQAPASRRWTAPAWSTTSSTGPGP
jgi:2-polyprenyl-6-hydroxyphenyl methylase/3-demethylubiquinone-9 3-methyltransferase